MFFTDEDFNAMGWHDNLIRAVAFFPERREVALDIDYIFKWELPEQGDNRYRFWISPATLVFEDVAGLSMQHEVFCGTTILGIQRVPYSDQQYPRAMSIWQLDCAEGGWDIRAAGFRQFIRKPPILLSTQVLPEEIRGPICFECPARPNQATPTSRTAPP